VQLMSLPDQEEGNMSKSIKKRPSSDSAAVMLPASDDQISSKKKKQPKWWQEKREKKKMKRTSNDHETKLTTGDEGGDISQSSTPHSSQAMTEDNSPCADSLDSDELKGKKKKKKSKNKAMAQHATYRPDSPTSQDQSESSHEKMEPPEEPKPTNNNGVLLESYAERHSESEPPLLAKLRAATKKAMPEASHMTSGPLQGRLLKQLVAMKGARRVLEIGTFCGYSGLCMAEGLVGVDALSRPLGSDDGKSGGRTTFVTLEIDPVAAKIAADFFTQSEHCDYPGAGPGNEHSGVFVDLRVGPAMDSLKGLALKSHRGQTSYGGAESSSGSFDVVFIDADKRSYREYYDFLLDPKNRLLAPGALIMADNVLFKGLVLNSEPAAKAVAFAAKKKKPNYWQRRHQDIADALHEFNAYAASDSRTEAVLLPLRDGVTLLRCVS